MASSDPEFMHYCCELLSTAGPCRGKRMFGGWGISTDGLTIALIADLGGGETLWLKANQETQARFEAAGCERFVYHAKGKAMQLNYFSAPPDAMESPALMEPWARLALQAALVAAAPKGPKTAKRPKTTKKRTD